MADEYFHQYDGVTYGKFIPAAVLDREKEFVFRPDDVVIASYLKSGGVTMCELVWLIMNEVDMKKAADTQLRLRVKPIDIHTPWKERPVIDDLESMQGARIMSTFISHNFFAKQLERNKPKVIVLFRNPKDVLVAYYHFYKMYTPFATLEASWDDFFEMFKRKELNTGDWFDHVTSWWRGNYHRANFLFVKFEDFIGDPRKVIKEVALFCGKNLSSAETERLAEHTSWERMRENPTTNMKCYPVFQQEISPFFRKGVVGDWKNYFSAEQSRYVDSLYKSRCLSMNLTFQFE